MARNWGKLAADFALAARNGSSIHPLSREFALSHLLHLNRHESIDFIAANMHRFERHYITSLLLCCPELWTDWTIDNWLELSRRLSPRPPRNEFYDTGLFMDFIFLIRWVEVNPFEMLRQTDCICESDKLSILTYCWVYTPFFTHYDSDLPSGWSNVDECLKILREAQQKLIGSSTSIQPAWRDTGKFLAEVKSLFLHFGGNPAVVNIERDY